MQDMHFVHRWASSYSNLARQLFFESYPNRRCMSNWNVWGNTPESPGERYFSTSNHWIMFYQIDANIRCRGECIILHWWTSLTWHVSAIQKITCYVCEFMEKSSRAATILLSFSHQRWFSTKDAFFLMVSVTVRQSTLSFNCFFLRNRKSFLVVRLWINTISINKQTEISILLCRRSFSQPLDRKKRTDNLVWTLSWQQGSGLFPYKTIHQLLCMVHQFSQLDYISRGFQVIRNTHGILEHFSDVYYATMWDLLTPRKPLGASSINVR